MRASPEQQAAAEALICWEGELPAGVLPPAKWGWVKALPREEDR